MPCREGVLKMKRKTRVRKGVKGSGLDLFKGMNP
jgi:hypothetical protein